MEFVRTKKRLAAGGILFVAFLVWEGCVGFGKYAAIFEMVFGAVLATILFAGKVAEVQLRFWFTIFSMDIISGPISLVFHIAERYKSMNWWEKYSDVLYELILIMVFVVVVCTMRQNVKLRRKIDGFPRHYFVVGILVCICTSMLRVFVYSFGEGQTMAVQNVSKKHQR